MRDSISWTTRSVRVLLFLPWVTTPAASQLTTHGAKLLDPCALATGACHASEEFGRSLAVGDFDDDGFDDLAVGIPFNEVSSLSGAGSVHLFYGGQAGLSTTGDEIWHQGSESVPGALEADDEFGAALAVGDFNDDGVDDLAIGAPGEAIGSDADAGAVWVLFGSPVGITGLASVSWDQDDSFPAEDAEPNDQFGYALTACDVDEDGQDDLLIGAPFEDLLFGPQNAGTLHLRTSSSGGILDQDEILPVFATRHAFESFATELSCGRRFAGPATFAVAGAMDRDIGGETEAGGIEEYMNYEAPFLINPYSQADPEVPGAAEASDNFGNALAHGDFDGNGADELAVGVFREDLGAVGDAGGVVVQSDYEAAELAWDFFSQTDAGGAEGAGEEFGTALAVGDFDGDAFDDLAISAPGESSGATDSGAVSILFGGASGLSSADAQLFHQNSAGDPGSSGVPGTSELDDRFGNALAAGDFDGNGVSDLAIGTPEEGSNGETIDAGAVTVLYGGRDGALHEIEFALAQPNRSEDGGSFVFDVERLGSGVLAASARISVTGGTAVPGVHYNFTTTTVSWPIAVLGDRSATLAILPNTVDDGNRTVVFGLDNLSPGGGAGLNEVMTVTIVDNDVAGAMAFATATDTVLETSSERTVIVSRAGGAASAVTVDYAAIGGTATAGLDFVPVSGTLTFGAGQSSRSFAVPILDDPLVEGLESILLTLSNPGGGGTLGSPSTATLFIADAGGDTVLFADGFESGDASRWSALAN